MVDYGEWVHENCALSFMNMIETRPFSHSTMQCHVVESELCDNGKTSWNREMIRFQIEITLDWIKNYYICTFILKQMLVQSKWSLLGLEKGCITSLWIVKKISLFKLKALMNENERL